MASIEALKAREGDCGSLEADGAEAARGFYAACASLEQAAQGEERAAVASRRRQRTALHA